MSKYIDAALLREKIAEQMESLPREVGRGAGTITSKGYGMMEALQIVRSIIDSLQQEQPEVDLEKEIDNYLSCSEDIEECADNEHYYVTKSALLSMARYFFTHGRLNAKKEE